MRPLRKAVLAGAAALALVGVAGWAVAEIKNTHRLDIRLPDGSVAHIRYVGDTPPMVSFAAAPMALPVLSPPSDLFGPGSPFVAMARISQALDHQADAMLRAAGTPSMQAFAGPDPMQADLGRLPPGVQGFSMVSTMSGTGVCTRSVQYRSLGDGKPPQVVTRTSGACAADQKAPTTSVTAGSAPQGSRPEQAGRRPI